MPSAGRTWLPEACRRMARQRHWAVPDSNPARALQRMISTREEISIRKKNRSEKCWHRFIKYHLAPDAGFWSGRLFIWYAGNTCLNDPRRRLTRSLCCNKRQARSASLQCCGAVNAHLLAACSKSARANKRLRVHRGCPALIAGWRAGWANETHRLRPAHLNNIGGGAGAALRQMPTGGGG